MSATVNFQNGSVSNNILRLGLCQSDKDALGRAGLDGDSGHRRLRTPQQFCAAAFVFGVNRGCGLRLRFPGASRSWRRRRLQKSCHGF